MRVIADLHIHSRYSRATSIKMNIPEIARFARIKGLNLIGTGDFTHPRWMEGLKRDLEEVGDTGLYRPRFDPTSPVRFMITGEVSTIFTFRGRIRKVHHVVLTPSIEVAEQVNDRLGKYGDLLMDGRPVFNTTAAEIVEEIMEASADNVVIPAHAWTPWFSLFGAFSGFDRLEDCYQDMSNYIFAIETGLSSDPPMNWRLSALDEYALVSNSDSHSAWPWRIGREANVFEIDEDRFTYDEIVDAIRLKDARRFRFTIEVDPRYGKYHETGCRRCGISVSPRRAIALKGRCPVCHKRLTKGVEARVDELADREYGFRPEGTVGYMHLLPLHEVIASAIGVRSFTTEGVWRIYNQLVKRFGDEYTVLMEAPQREMAKMIDPRVAEAIVRVRRGRVKIRAGYDGVYGVVEIFGEEEGEGKEEGRPALETFFEA
ncbi:TPA: DNA helicase UvrD [Candidatus Bathyarchaeota archaeon]|nr:DNA helicase UvrD [Candidatus Bathyarchaeota archaeon]